MAAKSVSKRYRLSIPEKNISLNDWCREQGNLSESLRYLIKKAIEKEGIVDIMCLPVEQLPRRGRPPISESQEEMNTPQETVCKPEPIPQATESAPPREPTQNNSDLLKSMLQ